MRKFLKTMNIVYERCLLTVFVLILLVVIYCMYDMYYVFEHAGNKDILKYKPTAPGYDAAASPIGEDMIAWITLDNTNIDYPIMQGLNNTKYLNTDPYGQYSLSGSIYLDCRNNNEFKDKYNILYGHHMEYGKMFGALDEYLDPGYLNSHSKGTLMIGRDAHTIYNIKVFAAMTASARDDTIFDPASGGKIYQYIKSKALIFNEERNNRIIAMSTCTEADSVTRVVVFAYILDE